jgi:hypothetical protein
VENGKINGVCKRDLNFFILPVRVIKKSIDYLITRFKFQIKL